MSALETCVCVRVCVLTVRTCQLVQGWLRCTQRGGRLARCSVVALPLSEKYGLSVTASAARQVNVSRRRGVEFKY